MSLVMKAKEGDVADRRSFVFLGWPCSYVVSPLLTKLISSLHELINPTPPLAVSLMN